ncbi:glutathione S-transferase family protein [Rhizobium oryzicola]|uniref:Glutathione S-transferase family protein n=1 Tax=Rhizobium oryzicola TaxID=1232668 RepID=A0ABT8SV36_9HYPH|nr:glutathione S-transferase family protein [Rhizobium oryzicola]MDO1581753.1 glutathione S-transferase family protein [Rhizobium oryzicola]
MFTLYVTKGSGNCFKPFLALVQLRQAFQVINVDILSGETRSDAFRAINPAAAVPYLRVESGEGVGESNAMLWFLADGSGLMPATPLEQAQSLQWMFFEQSKLEPFISPARFLSFIAPERGQGREQEIEGWREKARTGLAVLDAHLQGRAFMLGNTYGITDIALFGYVHVGAEAGIDMNRFPSVTAWMRRVEQTPDFTPLSALCATAKPFSPTSP